MWPTPGLKTGSSIARRLFWWTSTPHGAIPANNLSPILEEISQKTTQVKFVKVDVDQHRDLAIQYGVNAVPCLILFKHGQVQTRKVGFQDKESVESILRPYAM